MASRILYNSGLEIDQAISGAYPNIILRGSGFVRDTGVQNISGQKFFYDTITFYSGVGISGDFVPSGDIVGNLAPKATNVFDLGSTGKQWHNLFLGNDLRASGNSYLTGNLSVGGNTTLNGDFSPTNIAVSFLPKINNVYNLGSSSQQFANIWIDGTGRIDALHVDENAFVSGNLSVSGNYNLTGNLAVSGTATVQSLSAASVSSLGNVSGASFRTTGTANLGVTTTISVISSGSGSFGRLYITGTGIPTSTTGVGVMGQIVIGSGYLYACTGTNRWARTHLTGWV